MATSKAVAQVKLPKLPDGQKILVQDLWSDGNAFYILGKCRRAAKKNGWTDEQTKAFGELARSGDYNHLIQTVMEYFDEPGEDEDGD